MLQHSADGLYKLLHFNLGFSLELSATHLIIYFSEIRTNSNK